MHEAAGHFVSVVRKQREMTVEAYLFSVFIYLFCMFYSIEDSSQWDYPAYS